MERDNEIATKLSRVETLLEDITRRLDNIEASGCARTAQAVKEVMNTEEVAAYLGLSVQRIRTLTSQKRIPYYKPEGRNRNYYRREEIDGWNAGNRIKTQSETERDAMVQVSRRRAQGAYAGRQRI